ncbi:MAG: hypothetical protein ACQERW_07090, partial [Cyanobacteriota bacterium]
MRGVWRRRWAAIAALMSCCLVILVSCQPSSRDLGQTDGGAAVSSRGDRIRLGTTAQIVTLDPAEAYEQSSMMAIANLGEPLYRYEQNDQGELSLIPKLA